MENVTKDNPYLKSDPIKIGTLGLISALASLFVFGSIFSLGAISLGIFGIYLSFAKKATKKAFILNILALLSGISIRILISLLK